jgi:hypothetical protein
LVNRGGNTVAGIENEKGLQEELNHFGECSYQYKPFSFELSTDYGKDVED